MKFLIDTHCWLWWNQNSKELSKKYFSILEDSTNTIYLSAVISWEIAIKYSLGKLQLPSPPSTYIPERIKEGSFTPLSISHSHTINIPNIGDHHKDPFDRLLISQSQVEDIPLLSQDQVFTRYDVNIIEH